MEILKPQRIQRAEIVCKNSDELKFATNLTVNNGSYTLFVITHS